MDIQYLSQRSLVLYITEGELEDRGMTAAALSEEAARSLLADTAGVSPGPGELEVYPGPAGVLVFLRRSAPDPVFFQFDSLADVIAAAGEVRDVPSSLYELEGRAVLALWPTGGVPDALGEFGERLDAPGPYLGHLEEHGRCLIPTGALRLLRQL